jgi:hypothetical protein
VDHLDGASGARDILGLPTRLVSYSNPSPGFVVSVSGKRVFEGQRQRSKITSQRQLHRLRHQAWANNSANSGLFRRLREISANLGLRGGPERIRTTNQTIIAGLIAPN